MGIKTPKPSGRTTKQESDANKTLKSITPGVAPLDPLPLDVNNPEYPSDITPWNCSNPKHLHATQEAADRCNG